MKKKKKKPRVHRWQFPQFQAGLQVEDRHLVGPAHAVLSTLRYSSERL